MMSSTETIYALATPPGRSGVAVIRLSGSGSQAVAASLGVESGLEPRKAALVTLRDPFAERIVDQALALYFPAPHSFTGEDIIELHVHGSMAVIRHLFDIFSQMQGVRLAHAGEFSRRAFMNGKLDLLEAEGLADLIDSETIEQKAQALKQLYGKSSAFYEMLRTNMISVLAQLEAYIDFPDEDIPEAVLQGLQDETRSLISAIEATVADDKRGERLRDGLSIVILGAPNAGKSSLLNMLANRDAAIVSDTPGTTRDVIEVHLDIKGYPVVLIDTAGIREQGDAIEAEGMRRALARAESADITLILRDVQDMPAALFTGIELRNPLYVHNKIDLVQDIAADVVSGAVMLSTKTCQGAEELMQAIENKVENIFYAQEAPLITRSRHREQLIYALEYLKRSLIPLPLELHCEELRQASLAIGKITGKIDVDELLDVIFSRFCIGK